MVLLRDRLERAAATDVSVLLTGETGTGKTMAARYLHQRGKRSAHAFVQVNCSAIPGSLFESELFGHEKGAFTGAQGTRRGLFELANRGTLFLDEVGELPGPQQAKLLTALDDQTFRRVGGERTFSVDTRIISATVRDPERAMVEGRLRTDLFHRIAVLRIRVPALRERVEDIVPSARRILHEVSARHDLPLPQLSAGGAAYLERLPWHGNMRELQHLLEAATVLARGGRLTPDILEEARPSLPAAPSGEGSPPDRVAERAPDPGRGALPRRYSFEGSNEEECERIREALALNRGNRTRAARMLGMSRATLRGRIRRYGL